MQNWYKKRLPLMIERADYVHRLSDERDPSDRMRPFPPDPRVCGDPNRYGMDPSFYFA